MALLLLAGLALGARLAIRALHVADLDSALSESLGTAHTGDDPLRAWSRVDAAMVALRNMDDPDLGETYRRVDRALAHGLDTAAGRDAVLSSSKALDAQVLAFPARQREGLLFTADAAAAAPRVKVYFINGWLTTYVDAEADANYLSLVLDHEVSLSYNHSWVNSVQLEDRCSQVLGTPVKADAICRWGPKAADMIRGGFETVFQEPGIDAASRLVARRLIPLAQQDITAGNAVIIVGHSQGSLFAQSIVKQLQGWWNTYSSRCPATTVPAGALYISPAFHVLQNDALPENERYVALKGDILTSLKIGPAYTALPNGIQEGNSVTVHMLRTYLQPGSESRQQILDRFRELEAGASNRIGQCQPAPSPGPIHIVTPTPTASPANAALGRWVGTYTVTETRRYEVCNPPETDSGTITLTILALTGQPNSATITGLASYNDLCGYVGRATKTAQVFCHLQGSLLDCDVFIQDTAGGIGGMKLVGLVTESRWTGNLPGGAFNLQKQ